MTILTVLARRVFHGVGTDIELPPHPAMDDAIARKVELFGSGTGWDTVYNFGPYRDLVGESADSLTQGTEPAEIEIVDETLYDQVDPTTGIVPALIRASVDSATYHITTHGWPSQSTEPLLPPHTFTTGLRRALNSPPSSRQPHSRPGETRSTSTGSKTQTKDRYSITSKASEPKSSNWIIPRRGTGCRIEATRFGEDLLALS